MVCLAILSYVFKSDSIVSPTAGPWIKESHLALAAQKLPMSLDLSGPSLITYTEYALNLTL